MKNVTSLNKKIAQKLKKSHLTLGIAESCTGGLLSKTVTDLPGASKYFKGAIIAYNNDIKASILKINRSLISKYGAVSPEIANKMSEAARKQLNTDIGLSVTGIAGPGGGSKKKPLGLVYISASGKERFLAKKFHFKGSRAIIRKKTVESALQLLREILEYGKN